MTTAVVIPCRNEARSIGRLLDALAAQTLQPHEIVVVDDQSTDETATVLDRWLRDHPDSHVRVIAGPGRGPGPAMNLGIEHCASEVVVRLDGHAIPDPRYLEQSLRALGNPKVGVAGGAWRVRAGGATKVADAIAHVVAHPLGSGGALYRHPEATGPEAQPVETVPFGAFRRALWEQLGGFDESLSANQDFDFNYRARRAGLEVVLDRRIQADYFARPTLDALRRQYFRYGYWKYQMLRKDPRAVHWRQFLPMLILPWVLVTLLAVLWWPSRMTAAAVGLYPATLVAAALQLALRGAAFLPALAALATVHLGWSAGFWRGMAGGSAPVR